MVGFRPERGRSPTRKSGKTTPPMAWDEPSVGWLLRPSMACPSMSRPVQQRPALSSTVHRYRPHTAPAGIGQGNTHGPAVTRRAAQGRVLRLASYFRTVLSAVLTSARQRGSSFTRVSGMYSAPLRSGASSPTVFKEVVKVGNLPLCHFF